MASHYTLDEASPLGPAKLTPSGALVDPTLAGMVASYKRTIASSYRSIRPDELRKYLPAGQLLVSPKVDGQIWFLILEEGEAILANPAGRVIAGQHPVLVEATRTALPRTAGRTVIAGELFALRRGGRPRVGDVAVAMSGGANAEVARMGFFGFDLIEGGDAEAPAPGKEYPERLATLERLLEGGKRLKCVRTETIEGANEVIRLYKEWVEGGAGEGLVVRPVAEPRVYKVKPVFTLDAVIVGYTNRREDPTMVRSLLLALMRENGQFQLVGTCGGGLSDHDRGTFLERLQPLECASSYRHASREGALYRLVRPEVVIEIEIADVQTEDAVGRSVPRMVLEFDEGWRPTQALPGVSMFAPRFKRLRDDKEVNPTDIRVGQLLETVLVEQIDTPAAAPDRPASTVLVRRAWAKVTKGNTAVRKLLVWKTNKDEVDPRWPPFVVHWTDYSPTRKDPLKREVKLAPDQDSALELADALITKHIKRGWNEA